MSFLHIQTEGNTGTGVTTLGTANPLTSVSLGNTIMGRVKWEGGAATPTVTDTLGNTYTVVATQFSDLPVLGAFFYCASATVAGSNNTVTVNFGGSRTFAKISASQVSGLGAFIGSVFISTLIGSPGAGSDTIVTDPINIPAPSLPAYLWGFADDLDGGAVTAGTGFTNLGTLTDCCVEQKTAHVTSAGNITATFGTAFGSHNYLAGVMAFAEAGGSTAVTAWLRA